MNKRLARLARDLGAKHVGRLPNVGGGAFGMARLVRILTAAASRKRSRQKRFKCEEE